MAFLPDNRRAVVTMEESDRLALVDIETLEILRIYDTGGREGHMVRLSPDGSRAYVTSRLGKGTLSVIFLEEERDPVVIVTGGGAEGIAVSPDGSEIWVANRTEGTISVVSAASLEVVATRPSHPFAGRVEMPAGRGRVRRPCPGDRHLRGRPRGPRPARLRSDSTRVAAHTSGGAPRRARRDGLVTPSGGGLRSLAVRGETPASHRGRRGAPPARRDDREYREYWREEQRSRRGCIAGRMQLAFHHGLPGHGEAPFLTGLRRLLDSWRRPASTAPPSSPRPG
jgi:DNA-binding beta-propeller fold protein YncE